MGALATFFGCLTFILIFALVDTQTRVLFYKDILKKHLSVCGQEVKENPQYWASEGMVCFSPPRNVCILRDSQFICK